MTSIGYIRELVRRARTKKVTINLNNLSFIQFPEYWVHRSARGLKKNPTKIIGGNWDTVRLKKFFWSSKYEHEFPIDYDWATCAVMVPLNNYHFYNAVRERFLCGADWQDTKWYQWITSKVYKFPIARYESGQRIAQRLQFLDRMFADFRNGRYYSIRPLPIVNIGRNGRVAIENGRHRLCLAKVAGIQQLEVDVSVGHSELWSGQTILAGSWQELVDELSSSRGLGGG